MKKCRSGWYGGHDPDGTKVIQNDYGTRRSICINCKKPLVEYDFLWHKWRLDKSKSAIKTKQLDCIKGYKK